MNTYIRWYNEARIKLSLGYRSPMQHRRNLVEAGRSFNVEQAKAFRHQLGCLVTVNRRQLNQARDYQFTGPAKRL